MNIEQGWNRAEWGSPRLKDAPIVLMRDEWSSPIVGTWAEMNPASNIAGLFWKKTGIYREIEAILPPEVFYAGSCANVIQGQSNLSPLFLGMLGGDCAAFSY